MFVLRQLKRVISELGALPLLVLTAGVAVVMALLLALFGAIGSTTVVGFFGVIIGSGIASSTSMLVARENRRGQLAIAALDRRLDAHQKAYAIWYDIWSSVHDEKLNEVLGRAHDFWKSNCLYLDPASRKAFRDCIQFAASHKEMLQGPRTEEAMKRVKESWSIIMEPGKLLVEGVELPSLGEREP